MIFDVDKGDYYQRRAEEKQRGKCWCRPEAEKKKQGQNPVEQFDQRVLKGNMGAAPPAFPPEKKIAHQRNIVIPANLIGTVRAMRGGGNNRFVFRHAADADIQE